MLHRSFHIFVAATCGIICATSLQAQSNMQFAPAKVKQVRKINKSFKACKSEALKLLKAKKINKQALRVELTNCSESFPGAVLFTACKARALKVKKNRKKELAGCRRFVKAASFDPKSTHPFFMHEEALYFGGIGLNKPVRISTLDLPNFNCAPVKNAVDNIEAAQFLLFGNHPRTFAPLNPLRGPGLMKALRMKEPAGKEGRFVKDFGKVYGDPRDRSGVAFFPAAACHFNGDLGPTYSGLSAYYLINDATGLATPYFGIAYYSADQKKVGSKTLLGEISDVLGKDFKRFPKDKFVSFLATSKVTEIDEEKDPKNLCRKPRPHQWVAVFQTNKENPARPAYVILANVKNLCEFGDNMAKRLVP